MAFSISKKIGIYGGTFDPIHHGHLILAREALERLQLEKIIFVPAAASPHKLARPATDALVRLEMIRAAIEGEDVFDVDDIELRRPMPSFTIDTVEELRRREAQTEIFYLIGEDNLESLQTWRRFEELQRIVQFVVLERTTSKTKHSYLTVRRHVDISATEVRNRVATGRSIRYLVPPAVDEIIRRERLYKETER